MENYEKLGAFYLGKKYDIDAGKVKKDELLLYESKDLTTHGVCVGMTGSGKTGLCLGLLEEAAMDGIPAIAIDPKGDLGNLMLTFPDLKPSDFAPWIDESEAQRKGMTPAEFAKKTASTWKKGLGEWDQDRQTAMDLACAEEVKAATKEAEKNGILGHGLHHPFATMFEDVFEELPWHLKEQSEQAIHERETKFPEGRPGS